MHILISDASREAANVLAERLRLLLPTAVIETAVTEQDAPTQRYNSTTVPCKRLQVRCFGTFEVFLDGQPVAFPRQKSKELLAFLIDRRGAQVTMAEIANVLWEDGRYDTSRNRQIHTFLHDLQHTLDAIGFGNLLIRHRNAIAVDTTHLDCDVYRFLEGDTAITYTGEYMSRYWWAEFTIGTLEGRKKR